MSFGSKFRALRRIGDIDKAQPALRHRVGVATFDLPVLHANQPRIAQRDIGVDDLLHFFEAVIGGDEDRRAVAQTGARQRIEQVADQPVGIGVGRVARDGAGAVGVIDGVGREQVIEQQIGLVFLDDVRRGLRPDGVAPDDGPAFASSCECRPRHRARGDHLLLDRTAGLGDFEEFVVIVPELRIATQSTCAVFSPALNAAS